MSPEVMQNNKDLEVQYIIESINEQNKIETQPGYKISINDKVRLIEKKKELKKTRYNVTPYYFIITDIEGKQFTISAEDGSIKTVTSSQIIPVKNNELNIKQAKTIDGGIRGSVSEILKYYPNKDSYQVKFNMPNNEEPFIDIIKIKELRANKPLIYSKLEMEFFNKNKYYYFLLLYLFLFIFFLIHSFLLIY
jgi:hypothetical protein